MPRSPVARLVKAVSRLARKTRVGRLNGVNRATGTQRSGADAQGGIRYRPVALHWFGTIARVDRRIGLTMLQSADETFELSAVT
jgi:hypothetical protein